MNSPMKSEDSEVRARLTKIHLFRSNDVKDHSFFINNDRISSIHNLKTAIYDRLGLVTILKIFYKGEF